MPLMRDATRRAESGVVLLIVLVFALLLTSSIATFMRRATVDAMIARNREAAARAETLARGGVRLSVALILDDRVQEGAQGELAVDGSGDAWARITRVPLPEGDDAELVLRIEDSGARLNLNAVMGDAESSETALLFLEAFLEKVVDELPGRPEDKLYDPRELAANLYDYLDADEERSRGGPEDAYYQEQDPPYRAANRPLMSVDELRMIEGFDGPLVEGLRPYVTVFPYAGGGGVNLNTAPPHILALLYFNDGVEYALAREDTVRQILKAREDGGILCGQGASAEGCTPISGIVPNAQGIFPPPTFTSEVFVTRAEARVGEVKRSVEAVIDRSDPERPRLLFWRAG